MPMPTENKEFSYEDYLTWPDDQRCEILDSSAYMRAAPSRIHQEITGELFRQFANYLQGKPCKVYHAPFCVRLDNEKNASDIRNVVEPDITIVCDRSKLDNKGCKGVPDMIIEVISPSSGKMDRILKFNRYEKAGVKEYWIVEPDERIVSVFTLQDSGRYGRPDMYTESNTIKSTIFPDCEIDLGIVFG